MKTASSERTRALKGANSNSFVACGCLRDYKRGHLFKHPFCYRRRENIQDVMRTECNKNARAPVGMKRSIKTFPKLYSCASGDFSVAIYSCLRSNLCSLSGSRRWGGQGLLYPWCSGVLLLIHN